LRTLSEFLQKLPLEDLAPDTHTVKHAAGIYVRVLASPAHDYGMYLDGRGPSELTLDLPSGEYSGAWVDVATGNVARPESFLHGGGDKVLRTPDFRDGIGLWLRRTGR
jgi:hypothetical protein